MSKFEALHEVIEVKLKKDDAGIQETIIVVTMLSPIIS